MAEDSLEIEILDRLDKKLGFVDPEEEDMAEDPPRPVSLPLGAAKAFLRPTPVRLSETTLSRGKIPSGTIESWGKTGVDKKYPATKARIKKSAQTLEHQTNQYEYLSSSTRNVWTMGHQVYFNIRPGL
ncbi:uncharacterized protein LOC123320429 [Coccinella septempunctata]|uniref:uncharacterized protein LOC123320429 n=1 Tax=Coccinella septempunctata TaxID=41139 RepID=UPI001D070426|nr:uncharacterized protein LOC123320429 [Coccinella septempunctata]